MKKIPLRLILLLLAWGIIAGASHAGAQQTQRMASKNAILSVCMPPAQAVAFIFSSGLGAKLTSEELDLIRGKGVDPVNPGRDASSTHTSKIILWDEVNKQKSQFSQSLNHTTGVAGRQYNRLFFSNP